MLETIKKWLSSHNVSTHSIVAVTSIVVTMYYEVPQVHDYVWHVFTLFPAGLKNLIVVVVAAIAWYWKSRKAWTDAERAARLNTNQKGATS